MRPEWPSCRSLRDQLNLLSPSRFEGHAVKATGTRSKDLLVKDSFFFERFPEDGMEPTPEFKSVLPDSLVPVTGIDLAALSEIYDEMDIYLSIYMKSASRAELDASHSSIDLMNKYKKGGWSQMRFNRLRKGAIKSFLGQVAEDVLGLEHLANMRGLVIAGPGDAKSQLVEMFPLQMRGKVMAMLDVPMGTAPADLVKMGDQVALEKERSLSRKTADDLRSAVLKGQLSAYGTDQVRDVLMQGRVNSLVLLDNFVIPGWICEKCQHFQEGRQPENCPHCGGRTSRVNVLEELYELAQRTGAHVEFVDEDIDEDEFLQSLGGVAAILRY